MYYLIFFKLLILLEAWNVAVYSIQLHWKNVYEHFKIKTYD